MNVHALDSSAPPVGPPPSPSANSQTSSSSGSLVGREVIQLDDEKLQSKKSLYIVIACVVAFVAVSFLTGGIAGALLAAGMITVATAYGIFLSGMAISLIVASYFSIKHGAIETSRSFLEKHPTVPMEDDYKRQDGTIDTRVYVDDLKTWFSSVKQMQQIERVPRDYEDNIEEYLTNSVIDPAKLQTAYTDLARGRQFVRVNGEEVSLGVTLEDLQLHLQTASKQAYDKIKQVLEEKLGDDDKALADEILASLHIGSFVPLITDFRSFYHAADLDIGQQRGSRKEITIDIQDSEIRFSTTGALTIFYTNGATPTQVGTCIGRADFILSKQPDGSWEKSYSTSLIIT
ncbi:MAG: hypothetical protein HY860_06295 [Chlamydiales bacterium]|nr:hypothetical protein [Chlamydiales bacterium]